MNVRAEIRRGFHVARRAAGVAATLTTVTYGTADPMDPDPQITTSDNVLIGIQGRFAQNLDEAVRFVGSAQQFTISARDVSTKPTTADVLTVGGLRYAITDVLDVQSEVYILLLSGEAPTTTVPADLTPPTLSALSATGAAEQFTYSATSNENAIHRVRYRKPVYTGEWVVTAWSVSYVKALSGTISSLGQGSYEAHIQAEDAAGNETRWTVLSQAITVSGVPE